MTMISTQAAFGLPYKSVAGALLFSVILGPVGLLYASFWGGVLLIVLSVFVLINKFFFVGLLIWLSCCIWSVGAVESYNKKIATKAF
jgi:hypothetical protein